MIQGHIDKVTRTRVEGWLHSDTVAMAGVRLEAYVGDECVGAGAVELFREDLLMAGIGDGTGGFGFSIQLEPLHDSRLLEVRLESGSLLLRQSNVVLAARGDDRAEQRRAPRDAESLSWMLGRGWLTQEQFDLLHRLGRFGACRQPLQLATSDWVTPSSHVEIVDAAAQLLQLHMSMDVYPRAHEEIWDEDLASLRQQLENEFPSVAPVIALWAPWTNCVNVLEGSHQGDPPEQLTSGVDYEFGADHLLWLNLNCQFHVPIGGLTCPLTAYVPYRIHDATPGNDDERDRADPAQ